MPTTYIMQAKENYDAANIALINANTPHLFACTDQQNIGMGFDFQRRKIMYAVAIADATTTTNNTGHTLWTGRVNVPNGGSVDTANEWNLWIGEKDIDTGAVTFYQVYNVGNTVPSGIGGFAFGWVTVNSISNGQNIVLNGIVWTFVTGAPVGNQTQIQATDFATLVQLASDLNASGNASISGASYACEDIGVVSINYKTSGTVGNTYTLANGTSSSVISGPNLTGGSIGSDGTWRRMTFDMSSSGSNLPIMVNPHNNDVWIHGQSCSLYQLRHADSFQQVISPLFPLQNNNSPIYPVGVTTDWVYAMESANPNGAGAYYLHLIPSTFTSPETTADRLLPYATVPYPTPPNTDIDFSFFSQCLDHSGNFYVIAAQIGAGPKNIKLWKFTKPTSASYGSPMVGGGFSNVTPWSSSTGPNTNGNNYTVQDKITIQGVGDKNLLMFLPATSGLVAINKFTQFENNLSTTFTASISSNVLSVSAVSAGTILVGQSVFTSVGNARSYITSQLTGTIGGVGTYQLFSALNTASTTMYACSAADTFYDCTYVGNLSGTLTFDYHHAFVTGYMSGSWTPTNLAGAAYAVQASQEFNRYLSMSDFDYGIDYTKRWLLFSCLPVSGGVVDQDFDHTVSVLAEYQFVSGSPPALLQVFFDSGWNSAYPTYRAALSPVGGNDGKESVIYSSTPTGSEITFTWGYLDFYYGDPGVYDYTNGSWWLSGNNLNLFQLDASFTPRLAQCTAATAGQFNTSMPPFLSLSTSSPPIQARTSIQVKGRLSQPIPVPPPTPPIPPSPPNPFNCLVPVISQYANSPILLTILENFCEAMDPWPLINEFYNFLWNVNTAVGYGLDVWGRIVGVTRVLEIAEGRFMGFEEQNGSTDPFNTSPFFAGSQSGASFSLSDDAFRLLILVKALANITDGSTKSINTILRTLFSGNGNAYVADNGNMTMTYTFDFPLSPVQSAIINQSGVLPRSTGVSATVSVPI